MSSPYVCVTCRRSISHSRRNKSFQWHLKATFNSLLGPPQSSASEQPKQRFADSTRGFQGGEIRDSQALLKRPPAMLHATKDPANALEAMFEETLKQQSTKQAVHLTEPPQQKLAVVRSYEYVEQLRRMLKENRPLGDCWSFFVEHFGPTAWEDSLITQSSWPASLRTEVPVLLVRIRNQREKQPLRDDVPTFSEVILVTFELGLLSGIQWIQFTTTLIDSILKVGLETVKGQELLSELLICWNIVRLQRRHNNSLSIHRPKPTCPSMHRIYTKKREQGTQFAFSLLIPSFLPSEMYQLPTVVLGTLSLLLKLDQTGVGAHAVQNTQPLMSIFSTTVNACEMSFSDAAVFFPGVPESIVNLVTDSWSIIKEHTSKETFSKNFEAAEDKQTHYLHKEVSDALARKDVALLEQLWTRAQKLPTAEDGSDSDYRPGYLTRIFYNYFMLAFMSLKQQSRAIDVWNHMIKSGITPDLTAWDSLLNGCKTSRDSEALEQVWAMMIASGQAPDVHCWTTRISGLFNCQKANEGIRALDEMGRLWLAAVRRKHPSFTIEGSKKYANRKKFNDVTDAVRPTIATINAAVSGLVKMQEIKAAERILAWADQWGIIPDVNTYNTILGSIVREGHDKAPELLATMEGKGVQADAATFVTILERAFAHIDMLTPEERIEIINKTFLAMEQKNVIPNLFLYGKMIYLLLEDVPTDIRPVTEVMTRMARQNLTPSTFIYTILLRYYFAQSPPNLGAVNTLIERARLTVGSADHIFWDRLIEGYARIGDTSSAISYLRKVEKSKQFTSWNTMRTLLMALVENDEWDVAKELVHNAIADTGGPIGSEDKGVEGQHKFWALVRELGLCG